APDHGLASGRDPSGGAVLSGDRPRLPPVGPGAGSAARDAPAPGIHGPGVVSRDAARTGVCRVDPTPACLEGSPMIWGVIVLLAAALIGMPLSVALTATTVALGVVTGLLALLGVHARSAAV